MAVSWLAVPCHVAVSEAGERADKAADAKPIASVQGDDEGDGGQGRGHESEGIGHS